jgi:hypothetical protein
MSACPAAFRFCRCSSWDARRSPRACCSLCFGRDGLNPGDAAERESLRKSGGFIAMITTLKSPFSHYILEIPWSLPNEAAG